MAPSVQMESMLNSHYAGNGKRFNTVTLQVVVTEARRGQQKFAGEFKNLVNNTKSCPFKKQIFSCGNSIKKLETLLMTTRYIINIVIY